jgi:hypothetical protein
VLVQGKTPTDSARETLTRTRAELEAAGFKVVEVTSEDEDIQKGLDTAVESAGAAAAIAIESEPNSNSVEVWISDRLTKKLSMRRVDASPTGDTPALVAIRAVELLRASLIELRYDRDSDPNAPKKLPPPIERLTKPHASPPRPVAGWQGVGIELGIAGLLHVDPVSPAFAPALRLSYGSKLGLGGRFTWIGPSLGPSFSGALGSASVSEEFGVFELTFSPHLPEPIELLFAGGTGVQRVAAQGHLQNPNLALSDTTAAFVGTLSVAAGARLHPHVALDVEAFAAFTAPRIVIDMGKDRVGTIGLPILGATTGLRASF